MLNAAETTIKRWADENIIPCVRTPGGHRKFSLKEIVRFAETNGYTIGGSKPPPLSPEQMEQLETGVHARNYARIAGVFKEKALQADREGMLALLMYLYKQHIPFEAIIDEVVRPAFDVIGSLWKHGEIEVNQEHAATQATIESLVRMSPELHRKDSNGLTAVCACPEGELHEMGVRGLAYTLESEGWQVHLMGANTPIDTLTSFIRATRADLVCLSLAGTRHRGALLRELNGLASQVHLRGGKMIIGGHYCDTLTYKDAHCDYISPSIHEAVRYSRDAFSLKPGPKSKSGPKQKSHH